MIDRLSTFSEPDVIKLLQSTFVPATDNDWYNRRRKDAAGEFFRSVAKQGPRGDNGDATKQGHYILTPSGKLLGFNNNRSLERRKAFISDALAKWESLPAEERRPGAVEVKPLGDLVTDSKYHAVPPEGGVVLVASSRLLKRDDEGYKAISADDQEHGWGHLAAIDRMWIKADEWQTLAANGAEGAPLSEGLAFRLLRYHLVDFTRGEPTFWKRHEIRSNSLRIEPAGPRGRYILKGEASMATDDQSRGFELTLFGMIEVGEGDMPTRFDVLALGEHWGEGRYTPGARPGRSPLGIAFRLADPDRAADQIRPQASGWLDGYYHAER